MIQSTGSTRITSLLKSTLKLKFFLASKKKKKTICTVLRKHLFKQKTKQMPQHMNQIFSSISTIVKYLCIRFYTISCTTVNTDNKNFLRFAFLILKGNGKRAKSYKRRLLLGIYQK
jgi:hypothetical protein